ncbi:glycosyltransferase [Providencia manganoxydans]|uniref:glycosyltransferase n=1 Tax=Providencia manganoxydans TaxID=2923283 RepID=UPI0034DD3888
MNMKKVFIVLPSLGGGGAEKNIITLANFLSRQYSVYIICCYPKDQNKNINNLDHNINLRFLEKKKVIHSLPKLINIIRTEKPENIITTVAYFSLLFSLIIPLLPKKTNIICRETNIPEIYGKDKGKFYSIFSSLIYRFFYKKYNHIVCQSNDMFKSIQNVTKITEENQIIKINNPAIPSTELKDIEHVNSLPFKKYILSAGRLTYQKGFDLLITEYKSSIFFKENIPLLIAGIGPMEDALIKTIKNNKLDNHIFLIGFRNDINFLLKNALCFILSSRYEGFPNIVLESLYLGCPVIARNISGGINEIIKPGFNGFIYENSLEKQSVLFVETTFNKEDISYDIMNRFNSRNTLYKYLEILK